LAKDAERERGKAGAIRGVSLEEWSSNRGGELVSESNGVSWETAKL